MSTHSVAERVRNLVEPLLAAQELELVDIEHAGPSLKLTIDRPGGVDLDAISTATKVVSRALDEADPIAGRYTLEVSSPGLERPLRTPAHYARAVGEKITVKLVPGADDERRLAGTLVSAGDDGFQLLLDDGTERQLPYNRVDKARTVFEWGPAPRPGKPGPERPSRAGKKDKTR